PSGRAAGRRGRLRARLAVGPGALVLDLVAVARGSRLRLGAPLDARARGVKRRALLAGLLAAPAVAQAQDANLRELARRATTRTACVGRPRPTRPTRCASVSIASATSPS